jgi:hypothetical protein
MYIELAKRGTSDRGYIVDTKDYIDRINTAIQERSELYRSYYQYDEEMLEHMKIRKTVKGYQGKYYLDRLLFDIDKSSDTDEGVLKRTKMFIDKLYDWKLDEDNIQIWYSGRGYHIVTPDFFGFKPSNKSPIEVASTLTKYFPEADTIYDGARLIRAEYTLNTKGNKSKVLINLEEMFVDTVNNLATIITPSTVVYSIPEVPTTAIHNEPLILTEREPREIRFDEPDRVVTCVHKIYQEGETIGSRHQKIMRMASNWRRKGIPAEGAVVLTQSWAKTIEPYEVQRIVKDVYDKRYTYSCKDKIMSAYCSNRCIHYEKRDYASAEVTTSKDMEKSFREFVRSDFKGKVLNLKYALKLKNDFLIYPKEFVLIEGDTGTNKSTILQNILIATKMPSLMIVTENSPELTYRRSVQIKYGLTKEEVINHYKTNDNTYSQELAHIHTYCGKPRLDGIKRLIAEYEPRILAVDVLEDLVTDARDSHAKLGEIGEGLKEIANATGLFVIAVHHLSKYGATDAQSGKQKDLNVHSGKGNSIIEQKADKVIGIEGKQDSPHRRIKALKARDENPFVTAGYINMNTMRYISNEV